jgi:hypothetical protein
VHYTTLNCNGISIYPKNVYGNTYIYIYIIYVFHLLFAESTVDDTCNGNFRTMSQKFGIIKSPGFPHNLHGNTEGCYWTITPRGGQEVEITVHLSFSRELTRDCFAQFLQLQYKDCDSLQTRTDTFCKGDNINAVRKSCGTVYIMNQSYLAGNDRGNRFLVSYQGRYKFMLNVGEFNT